MPAPSIALSSSSREPFRLSFMVLAVSDAAPSQFSYAVVSSSRASGPSLISASMPDNASWPNSVASALFFCSSVRSWVLSWRISMISVKDFILPSLSKKVMPSSSMTPSMSSVGLTRRVRAPRSVVPAWLPLMPALESKPIAAAVSSIEIPIALATGATYFIASPVSATAAFVRLAFSASTSATCPASEASRPKPRRVDAAISALDARSSPAAAARSIRPGVASMISLVVKPADARFSIASAASVAENFVVDPNSLAVSSRRSRSFPVAPDIPATRDMAASKSEPTLSAYPDTPTSAVPAAANPLVAALLSLFMPLENPDESIEVSKFKLPSTCAILPPPKIQTRFLHR